ncbi:sensor histidine kinase [Micromonospora carbonacea]|uniref:sensor histidine kinase n=1 Tax=Micromonospora carbonacea TaxID=47853 RepID=UPI003720A17E
MTSPSSADRIHSATQVERLAAVAALCRAVLLGRAVVTVTASAAGLLIVDRPDRLLMVIGLVVLSTAVEVAVLSRHPHCVRFVGPALAIDALLLGAVLALQAGGAAFFLFAAGGAALAGVLLGTRAWPLWAVDALLGFIAAARILRADDVPSEVSAFVVAFPMATVVTGIVAAWVTQATVRHVDMLVDIIGVAQRSAAASERARLARELHDSVAKTLRGVSFAALALPASLRSGPELAEQLANVVAAGADAAAGEARDLIEGLRLDDADQDFAASLDRICREWSAATGTPVRLTAEDVDPSATVRYELSRIVREALHNVERHAEAGRVTVDLAHAGAVLRLTVEDDGKGFEVPADLTELRARGHYGLLGIAERARTVGGTATVRSSPGRGLTVEVGVPRPAPVPAHRPA